MTELQYTDTINFDVIILPSESNPDSILAGSPTPAVLLLDDKIVIIPTFEPDDFTVIGVRVTVTDVSRVSFKFVKPGQENFKVIKVYVM